MHILPEISSSRNHETTAPGSSRSKDRETSKSKGSEQTNAAIAPAAPTAQATASVTLERDTDGKFFYKVTNSRTGELIMEFPPEAVRAVSKGIEEYVQQHARSTKKLEAKA